MKTELSPTIKAALELAFEAGKWAGQVELEEHFDRQQYSTAIIESFQSKKTAMPTESASMGRTVKVNLRSNEWRDGVKKSSREYLEKAELIIAEYLQCDKSDESAA